MLLDSKKFGSKLSGFIWWLLYLMPILVFIIAMCKANYSEYSYSQNLDYFSYFNLDLMSNTFEPFNDYSFTFVNWNWLSNFGLTNNCLIYILNWWTTLSIIHICFDVVMFLPKLCHKFMKKFDKLIGGVENEK